MGMPDADWVTLSPEQAAKNVEKNQESEQDNLEFSLNMETTKK